MSDLKPLHTPFEAKDIERRMSYGLHNALRTPAKPHDASKVKGKESQSK